MIRIGKIARLTLGLILIIFGINGFTGLLGTGIVSNEADVIITCMESTRFLIPLLSVYVLIMGISFVTEYAAPIATAMVIPIILAAMSYYLIFNFRGSLFAFIALAANIILFFEYKSIYKQLFRIPPKSNSK